MRYFQIGHHFAGIQILGERKEQQDFYRFCPIVGNERKASQLLLLLADGATQRQWELVMGTKPSRFSNVIYYATRPVEQVRYNDIRGSTLGAGWPSNNSVDATSFMGKLRSKTGQTFDLPTEAQWEYACRAGTTTAVNSGKNLTDIYTCPNMAEVGRCWYNGGSGSMSDGTTVVGTAAVGQKPPNAWGLYDMHGNVYEWCLDWWTSNLGTEVSQTREVQFPTPVGCFAAEDRAATPAAAAPPIATTAHRPMLTTMLDSALR